MLPTSCRRIRGGDLWDDRYDGLVGLDSTLVVLNDLYYHVCPYQDTNGDDYLLVRGADLVISISSLDPADQANYPPTDEWAVIFNYEGYDVDYRTRLDGNEMTLAEDQRWNLFNNPDIIEVPELISLEGRVGRDLHSSYWVDQV